MSLHFANVFFFVPFTLPTRLAELDPWRNPRRSPREWSESKQGTILEIFIECTQRRARRCSSLEIKELQLAPPRSSQHRPLHRYPESPIAHTPIPRLFSVIPWRRTLERFRVPTVDLLPFPHLRWQTLRTHLVLQVENYRPNNKANSKQSADTDHLWPCGNNRPTSRLLRGLDFATKGRTNKILSWVSFLSEDGPVYSLTNSDNVLYDTIEC